MTHAKEPKSIEDAIATTLSEEPTDVPLPVPHSDILSARSLPPPLPRETFPRSTSAADWKATIASLPNLFDDETVSEAPPLSDIEEEVTKPAPYNLMPDPSNEKLYSNVEARVKYWTEKGTPEDPDKYRKFGIHLNHYLNAMVKRNYPLTIEIGHYVAQQIKDDLTIARDTVFPVDQVFMAHAELIALNDIELQQTFRDISNSLKNQDLDQASIDFNALREYFKQNPEHHTPPMKGYTRWLYTKVFDTVYTLCEQYIREGKRKLVNETFRKIGEFPHLGMDHEEALKLRDKTKDSIQKLLYSSKKKV